MTRKRKNEFIYPICNAKMIQLIKKSKVNIDTEYAKWGQVYHNRTEQYGYHKIKAGEYVCKWDKKQKMYACKEK